MCMQVCRYAVSSKTKVPSQLLVQPETRAAGCSIAVAAKGEEQQQSLYGRF